MGSAADGRIRVVCGDITRVEADAIVNAANERLLEGGGVCGAIFRAAGREAMTAACADVAPCPTGDVRLTPGFALPQGHVIHAVGPVWRGGTHGEPAALADCYRSALALAARRGFERIAFPALSTGIYGYPLDAACRVAVAAVRAHAEAASTPREILLVAFDDGTAAALERALAGGDGGGGGN